MPRCSGTRSSGGRCKRLVAASNSTGLCWQHVGGDNIDASNDSDVDDVDDNICRICYVTEFERENVTDEVSDDGHIINYILCEMCEKKTCRKCMVSSKSRACPHCRHPDILDLHSLTDDEYLEFCTPFDYTDPEREFDREHGTFEIPADLIRESNIQTLINELVVHDCYTENNANDIIKLYDIIGDVNLLVNYIHDVISAETPKDKITLALSFANGSIRSFAGLLGFFSLQPPPPSMDDV